MYITPDKYLETFREIKRTSLSHSSCKLVVFVSCLDIDSLCAAKILSLLLRKELIQYQLIPVVGYSDLKSHYLKLDHDVTNVFLVGCGAMLDLETFFELDPDEFLVQSNMPDDDLHADLRNDALRANNVALRRKIYIIDGHRPWNLDNIFGSSMISCFDDGFIDANLSGERSAYTKLVDTEDSEAESSEEESERSTDEDEVAEIDSDEDLTIHSQDSEETTSRKRNKQELRMKKIKRQRRLEKSTHEDTIQTYYNQGTTVMTTTCATIYAFLSAIGETSIDNLWLAIIGTSSLDSHYPEVYDKFQPLFKDEVLRLNPSNQTNGSEKTADTTTLSIERDYHLFLLRHWTLYDSFFYSSHVNSKLNLWTEDGKKKLHKLFAKMGVSLAVAQQKWLYMDIRVKKQLPLIFNKYLPLYGLEGIVRDGFIRTFGFTGQLSAMECVESLTALLELDKRFLNDASSGNDGHDENEEESDLQNEDERIQERIDRKGKVWVNNFWSSWDALNSTSTTSSTKSINSLKKPKGLELLLQGLEHAKQIQQIIFRTGMSLLERKLIKNLKLYRLCVLNDGSIPDLKIFNNPLLLSKLGSWLLENITELDFMNQNKSLKPLVVASLDVASDTYLVIGLAPKYPRGMDNNTRAKLSQNKQDGLGDTVTTRLNTFSVAFQQLATISGAKVRIDSFDSSVIEIRKDDLPPFLERLTLSGLI
ncbi:CDC45-like protein [Suhomyces tanzawaensis NRRL Y-17324]|uniref:CDC45-like protein n=1 Tax=Suhomyces tanzawaensis NRRL Y-17324 TaxID=984487 RepID=A0A1E4SM26_9ASCO|nr:CDC45-like protein [Suhomyces tanzawaensis NRRL Y-17324]ODV80579.1 CDC45-like protein [Suhomyces tanzawaensis NRRL Y-17324]